MTAAARDALSHLPWQRFLSAFFRWICRRIRPPAPTKGALRRLANNDISSRFGCMGVMSQQQERRVSRAIPLAALLAQTSSKQAMTSLFSISK
jgi:hypothetical protein